jgi:hypothetical protein
MDQLCPFTTRTVHGETDSQQYILLKIVTDKTETNTVCIQALTHKISNYFAEPLVQISSQKAPG